MQDQSNRIVAVSAGVIGVAALAVSAYQAYIGREQQRASVWPRIELLITNSATEFRLDLRNPGIGPALIRTAEVKVDGETVRSWPEVLAALGAPGDHGQGKMSDRVLSPEQEQGIFTPRSPASIAKLNSEGGRVEVWICYCSVYDDCWSASRTLAAGARMTHQELDDCSLPEPRLFSH